MSAAQAARLTVGGGVGAAYLWMGYKASISADPPLLSLLIGLAPLTFSAIALAWHSRSLFWQGLCAVCVVLAIIKIDFLRVNTAWVYFIQHAGMHLLLGVVFGRTLFGKHAQALCSRVAALIYADGRDPELMRYTWNVTLVWTVYFFACAGISILLFFFGSLTAWSVLANLLTPVLIGLIFVVEFLVRIRVLPPEQRASLSRTIQAYREYSNRNKSPSRP